MGVDFDGSLHYDISFSTPEGVVSGIVMILYLVATVVVLGIVINDIRKDPTKTSSRNMLVIQILFLLWQILQLVLNTSLCTPMIVWATNVVGSTMEILKAFCSLSKRLTPKILDIMRIVEICLFVILIGGLFISLGNVGRPSSLDMINWRIFGPGLIAFMGVLFETWHSYFLMLKLNKFQKMNSFLGKEISPEARKASMQLRLFVIFDIIMIWVGLLIYLYAFTSLKGAELNSLSAIGATLGESHCLTIIFVFKLVKNMNQQTKNSAKNTKGKSRQPSTSKNTEENTQATGV
ncbi:hypothetical protein HK103_001076 [Boothiomyces macroporosus]|uniref:Uncharacterized protein n=1 Tax=Boothiomyces macroporosus TaxID=261099 RepID=A0AAD5Y5I2_9FUNG|nr:hypothetical protein HK103_001076 [Boothiomyces macroporosus]